MVLPRESTPIDFAYSIHTEVGHSCVGAKVNGRMVPLRHKLHSGDIVEILTQPGHRPSRDWLSVVKSSRARQKIKHWLNVHQRERAIEIGRKLIEKEARKYRVSLKDIKEEDLNRAANDYGLGRADDLMAGIGYGKYSARQVLAKFAPPNAEPEAAGEPTTFANVVRRVFGTDNGAITVKGHGDLLVYRARCCNPIRGEKIVGYITRGKGVSVHSVSCPNVTNLAYDPDRRIAVEWEEGAEGGYEVRLAVGLQDRPGALAAVTAALAAVKTDVRSARPAGTPFVYQGELYRPAQDCSRTYGGSIVIHRNNGGGGGNDRSAEHVERCPMIAGETLVQRFQANAHLRVRVRVFRFELLCDCGHLLPGLFNSRLNCSFP